MRESSIPGNLNCIYACNHARVCDENKELELELEKNKNLLKYFVVKGLTLKGCRRTMTPRIERNLKRRIVHNIKVLVLQ